MAEDTPIELSGSLTTGATFHGVGVESVLLRLTDGRRVRFDLPTAAEAAGDADLSPTQQRILAVLRASPVPMKRSAVASKLHRKGGVRGKLGEDFRFLLRNDKIFEGGSGVTDDPSKLASRT